jgi:cell division protein FtsI (penicillin-binding protein 3)
VVIQNSNESKLVYGADVSGTVFKEISDKIYGRFLGNKQFIATANTDSTLYNFNGMKNDLAAVFNFLQTPFTDAAFKGNMRSVNMKNNFSSLNAPLYSSASSGSVTPNVVGMGLKDAVYLLETDGWKVTITGRGKIINQVPLAGTDLKKEAKNISIILN